MKSLDRWAFLILSLLAPCPVVHAAPSIPAEFRQAISAVSKPSADAARCAEELGIDLDVATLASLIRLFGSVEVSGIKTEFAIAGFRQAISLEQGVELRWQYIVEREDDHVIIPEGAVNT